MLQILLALNFPLLTGTLLPNEGNLAIVAFLPCSFVLAVLSAVCRPLTISSFEIVFRNKSFTQNSHTYSQYATFSPRRVTPWRLGRVLSSPQ
jgi:hypothetical protein